MSAMGGSHISSILPWSRPGIFSLLSIFKKKFSSPMNWQEFITFVV